GVPVLVGRNRRLTGRAACGPGGTGILPVKHSCPASRTSGSGILPVSRSCSGSYPDIRSNVCVLDDSFQYWRLRKDLELLLIDAAQPLARAHLFPRGRQREPVSAARRAHAAILTHADRASASEKEAQITLLLRHNPSLRLAEARHRPGSA